MKLTKKIIDGQDVYFEDGVKKYTHSKENSDGYEWWSEYDSNGNEIHFKNNDGYEWWSEYDSNGNEIHHKDNDGYEWWKEYDSHNNQIHFKNNQGYEWWSDTHPNNPKNREVVVEVDIEPFTFNKK